MDADSGDMIAMILMLIRTSTEHPSSYHNVMFLKLMDFLIL